RLLSAIYGLIAMNPESTRDALDRVLATPAFAGSERLCRFLRFVVEETLAGRASQIKESHIAVQVYGKRPDYDPKIDAIVRVEAGRLRGKLDQYYKGAGQADLVRFELPKGTYAPLIIDAKPVETPRVPEPLPEALPAPAPRSWRRWAAVAAAAGVAIVLG